MAFPGQHPAWTASISSRGPHHRSVLAARHQYQPESDHGDVDDGGRRHHSPPPKPWATGDPVCQAQAPAVPARRQNTIIVNRLGAAEEAMRALSRSGRSAGSSSTPSLPQPGTGRGGLSVVAQDLLMMLSLGK